MSTPFVSRRTNTRRRGGQTIVEAALVTAGILLPLTLGIIQFGLVINAMSSLQMISREGARFASVHGLESTSDAAATQSNPPSIRNYLQTVCGNTGIKYSDLTVTISPAFGAATRASGQPITITVVYPMTKKVFVGRMVPGNTLLDNDYTTRATFILE